ncbi:MAG: hypothetical protein MZV63_62890 [Marinilabiliales bacterium]|nr:hypothetical protein [Marinilabiliales bacterium]
MTGLGINSCGGTSVPGKKEFTSFGYGLYHYIYAAGVLRERNLFILLAGVVAGTFPAIFATSAIACRRQRVALAHNNRTGLSNRSPATVATSGGNSRHEGAEALGFSSRRGRGDSMVVSGHLYASFQPRRGRRYGQFPGAPVYSFSPGRAATVW